MKLNFDGLACFDFSDVGDAVNRFFIPEEGRKDYPRRSYGKLDQIEPPNLEETETITFAFDAFDADWEGFQKDKFFWFTLGLKPLLRRKQFWAERFCRNGRDTFEAPDPFDELPMYRIEFTLDRSEKWWRDIADFENTWFEINLGDNGHIPVDVFGGLFMPPVATHMERLPVRAPISELLNQMFGMDDWPDATDEELDEALSRHCDVQQLLVFDVGQGSANALVCAHGYIQYYYDTGCGVYRNAATSPHISQMWGASGLRI